MVSVIIKITAKVDEGLSTLKERFEGDAEHDHFPVEIWMDGVFQAASYAIESLGHAVNNSDFAIAIAY